MSTIPGIPYGPTPRAAQYAYALTQWDLIVVHDTGHHGPNWSIASAPDEARYAATRTDARSGWTTCHAYVDTNGPVGSLSLDLQAWAAFSWANGRGIHLEMCGENAGEAAVVPAATVAHTARLVRQIAALKGIPLVKLSSDQLRTAAINGTRVRGVCGHYDITLGLKVGDHSDPGPGFNWGSFMAQVNGAPTTQGDDDVDALQVAQINNAQQYALAAVSMKDATLISDTQTAHTVPNELAQVVNRIATDLADLKSRPPATVDATALASALVATPDFIAALAGAVAVKTADEEAKRLSNG